MVFPFPPCRDTRPSEDFFFYYKKELVEIDPFQSGFRAGFDIQTALVALVDDLRRDVAREHNAVSSP